MSNIIEWNPWSGCRMCSTGCYRCYANTFDSIKQNKSQIRLPIQKSRQKSSSKTEKYELEYKVASGTTVNVCTMSDFFIQEADIWRIDAWNIIHQRPDVMFNISTKMIDRVKQCLPYNWLSGWNNVRLGVSIEDNVSAWDRIPKLLEISAKHKYIEVAPMIEEIDIEPFLCSGEIEMVVASGECALSYIDKARLLDINWIRNLCEQCKYYDTTFIFKSTGSRLIDNRGNLINVNRRDQAELAKFYKIAFDSDITFENTADELLKQYLDESAFEIYSRIISEGLMN